MYVCVMCNTLCMQIMLIQNILYSLLYLYLYFWWNTSIYMPFHYEYIEEMGKYSAI